MFPTLLCSGVLSLSCCRPCGVGLDRCAPLVSLPLYGFMFPFTMGEAFSYSVQSIIVYDPPQRRWNRAETGESGIAHREERRLNVVQISRAHLCV